MKIKNKELKIEMLDKFGFATFATLIEINNVPPSLLPPYMKDLKVETILEIKYCLEKDVPMMDKEEMVKCLEALYSLNKRIMIKKIPDEYGNDAKQDLMRDLIFLKDLINEIRG